MDAKILSNEELAKRTAGSPKPKITQAQIEDQIDEITFDKLGETVTLCTITLKNGFSVRGESACVNAENYDADVGATFAYRNGFLKLWPLFGFMLAEDQHRANQAPQKAAA